MTDDTMHANDVDAVRDLALAATIKIGVVDNYILTAVVPEGSELKIEEVDNEHYRDRPRRTTGSVTLHDAASFAEYYNKHKVDGESTMYADVTRQRVVAVLNEPSATEPGWRDHRATLVLEHTEAWKIWTKHNGTWLTQLDFAELVEERLPDIVDPDGATMLQIALTFQSKTDVNFESKVNIVDGQRQYTYVEETTSGAVNGTVEIPQVITLGIAPFEISPEPYKVTARFRHRAQGGKLLFGYQLDQPEEVLRAAFNDSVALIEENTDAKVLYGTPAG